ncbi:MAG: pyruvate, phosphate dikinase [Gemmatimonadota bacterium]|nr:pyruvate, phosphate dikinase [Gemmatimonadota bacterium]
MFVYLFGRGHADGSADHKLLLGGKGANLAEMTNLGIPVPPGFTLTTEVCRQHLMSHAFPEGLESEVAQAMERLEEFTGKKFGGREDPLLLSVRSGAAISMPGMMDTVLNLGLNDDTVRGLAQASGDERFAWDSYRRFLQMYSEVVLGVDHQLFESRLARLRVDAGVQDDGDLGPDELRALVADFRAVVEEHATRPFPHEPRDQLWGAIEAVFQSWRTPRAMAYRKANGIPHDLGTAVNVQAMVYGNRGSSSGTGVAFTRNPSTGERLMFGEFLVNAQGEDVVAGIRDPIPIEQMGERLGRSYDQLVETAQRLEAHYKNMQDLEFTVEDGTLYLLQTRDGKRTARAAVRIAVEMVEEGLIGRREALLRVDPDRIEEVLHSTVDPDAVFTPLAVGNPASPGAASGRVVFTAAEAVEQAGAGEDVILVREETSPDDFEGMVAAQAIVTCRGGRSSHAAVVARGMGKCCVVGTRDLRIDEQAGEIRAGESVVRRGDWITVDGASGEVIPGRIPTVLPEPDEYFYRLMSWADEERRLRVRANADTPHDATAARDRGAEGIGLCRTEHMFFGYERIAAVREMILARGADARREALDRLLPMQRDDFIGIFRAMDGLPVTVRLLDPPLHEFLPSEPEEIEHLAQITGRSGAEILADVERLTEANPMLGHRGCRLAFDRPEITRMQTRAILEAALAVKGEGGNPRPEIMVPLVGHVAEFINQRALIDETAGHVFREHGDRIDYSVGTMIELPRACITAGDIASRADFFSFGTNDLTQTALGISRDDAGSFLPGYVESGFYSHDPFQRIDEPGVGRLMRFAVEEGRAVSRSLKVGICGEHGGDPASVTFCHELGLDYVSCSPFRVPVARLAAAHAALAEAAAGDGRANLVP